MKLSQPGRTMSELCVSWVIESLALQSSPNYLLALGLGEARPHHG